MNEEDLVKLLDGYMANDGGFIKPTFQNGDKSFIMAKNLINPKELEKKDGEDDDLFNGNLHQDCPTCADIPNISDFDNDDWF